MWFNNLSEMQKSLIEQVLGNEQQPVPFVFMIEERGDGSDGAIYMAMPSSMYNQLKLEFGEAEVEFDIDNVVLPGYSRGELYNIKEILTTMPFIEVGSVDETRDLLRDSVWSTFKTNIFQYHYKHAGTGMKKGSTRRTYFEQS